MFALTITARRVLARQEVSQGTFRSLSLPKKARHHTRAVARQEISVGCSTSQVLTFFPANLSLSDCPSLSLHPRHISAVHLRIRSHACEYPNCGKAFSERWTLQVHVVSLYNRSYLSLIADAFDSCGMNIRERAPC